MPVKKVKTQKSNVKTELLEPEITAIEPQPKTQREWLKWLLLLAALGLFWYRTNSWPIVAVVNYRPIWRWELEQAMYDQVGTQILDSLVVERLIADELANKKAIVVDGDVEARLGQIKSQIGSAEEFDQALALQGLTKEKLEGQIRMQLGLEKLVEPSTDSAKISQDVYSLVQSLRSRGRVWIVPRLK